MINFRRMRWVRYVACKGERNNIKCWWENLKGVNHRKDQGKYGNTEPPKQMLRVLGRRQWND
jgi:hypothetical protein